jgi:Cu-Zn family superoxide dismutase
MRTKAGAGAPRDRRQQPGGGASFSWRRRASWVAIIATGGSMLSLVAVALAQRPEGNRPGGTVARLQNAQGQSVGTVRLLPRAGRKVEVRVRLARLTAGFHALHVHEVGRCQRDARDAAGNPAPFFTAGGHFRTETQAHGEHAGDLPPVLVMRDGTARADFLTDRLRVRSLLAGDGSAVIVHALRDNLAHIPDRYHSHTPDASSTTVGPDAATLATGDAGPRVACGVLRKSRRPTSRS